MSQVDEWTIGRLLTWTADYLKQHGSESPRLDAEVLLAHSLGCKRIELYTRYSEPADEAARARFRELVRRRAEGAPVAHLVGHREFYSLDFRVSPDVLIPRPETEVLVMRLIELAKQEFAAGEPLRIADVGTGSGIIAVCAAKLLPQVWVTAIDSSAAALAVARQNAADNGVAERIEFVQSDLFDAVPNDRRFQLIASNPPYVSQGEFATLSRSVRDYEPRDALVAGPQGTEVIARLTPQAAHRLETGGSVLVEISPMIEAQARTIIADCGDYELTPTIKDLSGRPRVLQAKRK